MDKRTIEIHGNGIRAVIEGPAEVFFGQDLVERAVSHLIEDYDSSWQEKEGDDDAAYRFYGSVLSAVARHHWADRSSFSDHVEMLSTRDLLHTLIDALDETGKLSSLAPDDGERNGQHL